MMMNALPSVDEMACTDPRQLPSVPSTFIRLALNDLIAAEKAENVQIQMDVWHRTVQDTTDDGGQKIVCQVCMAGAVLRRFVSDDASVDVFGAISTFMPVVREYGGDGNYTEETQAALLARRAVMNRIESLDNIRLGNVQDFMYQFYNNGRDPAYTVEMQGKLEVLFSSPDYKELKADWETYCPVDRDARRRGRYVSRLRNKAFKYQLLWIAEQLENLGL